LTVPSAPGATGVQSSAAKPAAPVAATKAPIGIAVTCSCGRSLRAPESLKGRAAKCPGCGSMIQIPPAESAEVDIFSIDPLMRSDPLFAGLPAVG
jgi:hypothetical protein